MRILDENVEYITPTVGLMRQWFEEFNARFFNGELEPVRLAVETLEEGIMGVFNHPKRKYDPETLRYLDSPDLSACRIRLGRGLFDSEYIWREIMVHEMIHYYVYKHSEFYEEDVHGEAFLKEARRINRISEFGIAPTFTHELFSPGKRKQADFQKSQNKELILGVVCPAAEQPHNRLKFDGFSSLFLTEEQYIPMLIDNWRHTTASFDWYQVEACTKRMLLYDVSTWAWDYITYGPTRSDVIQKMLARSGSFQTRHLGTTQVNGASIEGWFPQGKRPRFRANYALREEMCANSAARHLINNAEKVLQASSTKKYYKGGVAYSKSPCRLDIDTRFARVRVFTPQALRINPLSTDRLVETLKTGNQEALREELLRLIRFENDLWL